MVKIGFYCLDVRQGDAMRNGDGTWEDVLLEN